MNDWTEGYIDGIGYTYGYYGELNPLRAELALLNAGFLPPKIFNGCELGFGQGVSIVIHAASSKITWSGTDFNPSQAYFAQSLADSASIDLGLYDESFAEYCGRTDLPQFDFIGLHGIWSWISNENREVLIDFIRRKLRVGGLLYIGYNASPGWAATIPLRQFLLSYFNTMTAPGESLVSRIGAAINFAEEFFSKNPAFANALPGAVDRLRAIKSMPKSYVAHEYFNKDWLPMTFPEISKWMGKAKMEFACSANYLDHVAAINVNSEQSDFIKSVDNGDFREMVRDYTVNQQFRKDYWVKGGKRITAFERAEIIGSKSVVLITPVESVEFKLQGAAGQATLHEAVYRPIVNAMANHNPVKISHLAKMVQSEGIKFDNLLQSLMVLIGKGDVAPAQEAQEIKFSKSRTVRINENLTKEAAGGSEVSFLASPVTGGGIMVGRFNQIFLMAISGGLKDVDGLAKFAWGILKNQNQRIMHNGVPLQSDDDNIYELQRQAGIFLSVQYPVLKALNV